MIRDPADRPRVDSLRFLSGLEKTRGFGFLDVGQSVLLPKVISLGTGGMDAGISSMEIVADTALNGGGGYFAFVRSVRGDNHFKTVFRSISSLGKAFFTFGG